MRKSVFGRVFLGLLAIAPLIAVALILATFVGVPMLSSGSGILGTMAFAVLAYAIASAYFLYVVQTDPALDSADKARWTTYLLMWFPFAAVFFWYQFIWRQRRPG